MGVLRVILLGFLALLTVSSSGDENAHRGEDDDGLIKKAGCEGHQTGDQWESSDHVNCFCQAPDHLCYHVDCPPGSEIFRDSNGLWDCEGTDNTGSKGALRDRVKRVAWAAALGGFADVLGTVGFIIDRIEAAQTTSQLNEIQDQIRKLDRKLDELTRSVSDLHLGQENLRHEIRYSDSVLRLRYMLHTLAKMQISNGTYVLPGDNVQRWADSVLSFGDDGVQQVLFDLLDMVKLHSGFFDGKSLMEIYHLRLIKGDNLEKYTEKMSQKATQIYGLIGGGYAVWDTALRIKGRTGDIPAMTQEAKSDLKTVNSSLQIYIEPKNWRPDWRCGPGYPADNGQPAECHPDSKYPCCSQNNWCVKTAYNCTFSANGAYSLTTTPKVFLFLSFPLFNLALAHSLSLCQI